MLPRGADKEPTQPRTTQTFYDSTYHLFPVTVTNAVGHTSTTEYYGVNDSECIPAGYHFGAVCRTYGPNGPDTATRYTYDAFGRLEKVIRPGDSATYPTIEYLYDDFYPGPTTRVRTLYRETSGCSGCVRPILTFYDGLGRVVQTKAQSQDGTQMIVSNLTYDARGLKEKEYVPYFRDGSSDFWDHVTPDTNQPKTIYAYDALGRVTQVTNPDNTRVRTYYRGWSRAVLDEKNHQKIYDSDAFGRLVKVRDYSGTYPGDADWNATSYATTQYAYDALDNLTTVTDTLGNVTTMSYDMLGRKIQMTDPDMGTWSYEYDAVGNLTRQTDARNQAICFYYDALNRLTGKTYRTDTNCPPDPGYGGYAVAYAYDNYLGDADAANSWGRRRATWVGSLLSNGHEYQYDERGRLIEETQTVDSVDYVTQYTYRADDQVHTMTYPGGEVVTTTYNATGLPQTLASSLGDTYVADASYTPEGRLDVLSLGSNLQVDHDYYDWDTVNGQGRLESIQSGTAGQPTLLQNLSYGYDAVGNVQSLTDNGQAATFTYDSLDRLTGASGEYSESCGYNAIGNLTYKSGVGSYSYASGKPHAVTSAGGNSYAYDANGNMTSRTIGVTYTLTYDAENRLKSVTQGGQTTTFTYDADGQRVMRETVTGTIVYVGSHYEARFEEQDMPEDLDGDCLITIVDIMLVAARWGMTDAEPDWDPRYDLDGDGEITVADIMMVAAHWRETCERPAETVKYYTLGGRRVAMRKVPADPPGQVGTLYYLFSDHLGSSVVVVPAGDLDDRREMRYFPYGERRSGDLEEEMQTDRLFTGQRFDGTIGLYDYGARYYDAALGRFVQADTIVPEPGNPQALNRYSYVLNNPLRYTDPSGYDPLDAEWEREFRAAHGGRVPSDEDRRDRLFSLLFAGSGLNGSWTEANWTFYSTHKEDLWRGRASWPGASEPSISRFALHVRRLAAWYKADEKTQFVRAFALVFGGIRYTLAGFVVPKPLAAVEAFGGPRLEPLHEGTAGWDPSLVDFPPDPNPSHHYAGIFFLGFFTPKKFAQAVNFIRDPDNQPDVALGNIAIRDAQLVRKTPAGHWLVERLIWSLAVII